MKDMYDFHNLFAVLIMSEYFWLMYVVRTRKEVQSHKFQAKMDQVEMDCFLTAYLQEGWKSLHAISTRYN